MHFVAAALVFPFNSNNAADACTLLMPLLPASAATSSPFQRYKQQRECVLSYCASAVVVRKFIMVQLSKSGVNETPELKAGHPPAVKAGGKRMVKKSYEEGHATHHVNPEREHKIPKSRSAATSSRMQHISMLLSGTLDKLGHDFPETPVSVKHSRLRPAMEKPHSPAFKSSFCIQQPKKF